MKKIILLLLLMAGIFESCKKYPDGPWLSMRSPLNRLYGSYTITQYNVNGVDSLSLLNDSLYNIIRFSLNENSGLNDCKINGLRNDGNISNLIWSWKLINNDKILKVTNSSCYAGTVGWPSGTGPFLNNVLPEWELLRLTNKEVRMKSIYNNKEYIVRLEILK
jgi:hypothetical protein